MESSSPQRRKDRGGDAEVNRGLQLSLRCLGGLCASAVNSIYSHAFLKALIVNNFNLHTLQLFTCSHFVWVQTVSVSRTSRKGKDHAIQRTQTQRRNRNRQSQSRWQPRPVERYRPRR